MPQARRPVAADLSPLCRPLDPRDLRPFCEDESGWHVRRGYSGAMLQELCSIRSRRQGAFFLHGRREQAPHCSHAARRTHPPFAWVGTVLPLRWAATAARPLAVVPAPSSAAFDRTTSLQTALRCVALYPLRVTPDRNAPADNSVAAPVDDLLCPAPLPDLCGHGRADQSPSITRFPGLPPSW